MFSIDRRLAKRFLAAGALPDELEDKLDTACRLVVQHAQVRRVYRVLPLQGAAPLTLDGHCLPGKDIQKALSFCRQAALFAVTLGTQIDTLIRRTQLTDLTLATMIDACASAAVEDCCDRLQDEIARQCSLYATDRFSPGYGDFPLSMQRPLLTLLNADKAIGVHLTPHLLMLPTKSVSALFGLSERPQPAPRRGCQRCSLSGSCPYRKEDSHCDPSC